MSLDDPREIAKATRAARARERQNREIVLATMSTTAGRRWFYDKLAQFKAFHTPYTGDTNSTMFNCGMQNSGFALLVEVLDAAPAEYLMMLRENSNATGSDDSSNDDSNDSGNDSGSDGNET